MPDLSSSPKPSAIIRVVLLLGRARERQIETQIFRQLKRDPAVFGGVRGGEEADCDRGSACLRHRFAERATPRRFAPKTSRNIVRSSPSASPESKTFGQAGGVDVHHHVDERFHFRRFARLCRCNESWNRAPSGSVPRVRKLSSRPPHIR